MPTPNCTWPHSGGSPESRTFSRSNRTCTRCSTSNGAPISKLLTTSLASSFPFPSRILRLISFSRCLADLVPNEPFLLTASPLPLWTVGLELLEPSSFLVRNLPRRLKLSTNPLRRRPLPLDLLDEVGGDSVTSSMPAGRSSRPSTPFTMRTAELPVLEALFGSPAKRGGRSHAVSSVRTFHQYSSPTRFCTLTQSELGAPADPALPRLRGSSSAGIERTSSSTSPRSSCRARCAGGSHVVWPVDSRQ
mmetsp:Transcript_19644/g.63048  ORF Transcript_19644/g.63048 Transcript_19644/m.63048 type:complete len:248 (+) Transcript_19644:732-1475(+)